MFSHIPSSFEPSLQEHRTVKADPFSSRSFWPKTICVALLGALSMQSVLAQGVPVASASNGAPKQVKSGSVVPVATGAVKDTQQEDPLEALLARVTESRSTLASASKAESIAASASASASASVSANDDTPLLEFRNVTFRYDNAESPALENISFTVHHGETLAIMGDIGSGKSTITNLIPRLFSIESGDILFKGKSIYEWNVDDLRSRIGYVPQKAYLFTGTVEMNIRYGAAPNQDISVQDIENACRLSKADEFISRLEGGYQYIVSQGGTNLSGGQRQRLAMARALVRKPDLFIFDDSFSALDGTTERAVRTVLHEELQNDNRPALISVEQKVSAAKKANHILIINRGQVAGYGTHDELAENSTVYEQILASQEVTE